MEGAPAGNPQQERERNPCQSQSAFVAVVLGDCYVERHITLDRAMWGSDQAASVEPWGFMRPVRDIRVIEAALGDGVKRVYESEMPVRNKLRRVTQNDG